MIGNTCPNGVQDGDQETGSELEPYATDTIRKEDSDVVTREVALRVLVSRGVPI